MEIQSGSTIILSASQENGRHRAWPGIAPRSNLVKPAHLLTLLLTVACGVPLAAQAQTSPSLPWIDGSYNGSDPRAGNEGSGIETVEQDRADRGRLVFRNHRGNASKGRFLNATTVVADDWEGGLRGTLENYATTIRWANGSTWSRAGSVVPVTPSLPWIGGAWSGVDPRAGAEGSGMETVEQDQNDRSRLVFRNHRGNSSKGHFLNSTTVVADDWEGGLRGTLANGGSTIRWANGSSWSRSAPAGPSLPSIGGTWSGFDPRSANEGNRTEYLEQDQNDRSKLVFRNHRGNVSRGRLLNATTVIADEWEGGLRGTLENNGRTIRWANGSTWSR